MKNYSAKEYALFLLKRQDRSRGEISKKMHLRKFAPEEIEETIKFLESHKIIDDERYARNYVKNQIVNRPQGQYLLRQKLIEKKIDKSLVDVILEDKEDEFLILARKAAEKWLSLHQDIRDQSILKNKLSMHLSGRGFSYDQIKDVVESVIKY